MQSNVALITSRSTRKSIAREQPTTELIMTASVGTVVAALTGGAIWGLLVDITGYEIGFMALVLGVLCGFVTKWSSLGCKGRELQAIAIISSLVGVIVGKYTMFFYIYRDVVLSEISSEAASRITILSDQLVHSFLSNINAVVSWLDIIWVGLAVLAAWEIPRSAKIKKAEELPVVYSEEQVA